MIKHCRYPLISEIGFSVIEGLLALLAIVLVVVAGWYVDQHNIKSTRSHGDQTAVSKPTAPVNPYAGWKSYQIPASTLSFQYPATGWQLNPATGPKGPLGLVPGTPETSLVASDGLYIDILTDDDSTTPPSGNTVLLAQALKTLGGTYYLDYIDAVGDHNVTYAALFIGPQASADYPSVSMSGISSRLVVSLAYQVSNGPGEKPLSMYRKDAAVQTAKLILASLKS